MTHWKKTVKKDSPYLGEWDVEGKTPLKLTIEEMKEEIIKSERGSEVALCAKFKGAQKMMILNSTNSTLLERQFGTPHREEWVGREVVLRRATTYNRKEKCEEICLRFDKGDVETLPAKFPKFTYIDKFEQITQEKK